ncbi:hypothetical protein HGRIS_012690 [Hohenbuehelia grisea]|uniref:DUF6534 domain-containing protein n=1 Tax=Hohenbuehelia grisea TaxID=104357 RepID=A0ABR3IT70_9AGAR
MSTLAALGSLELSVLLSVFLLGVVTMQTYTFFTRFPKDRWPLKALVASLWIFELLHAGFVISFLYCVTISALVRPSSMTKIASSIIVALFAHGLNNVLLQFALIYRLYIITQRRLFPVFLAIASSISVGTFFISLVLLIDGKSRQFSIILSLYLLLSAAIYFSITAATFHALRTSRKDKSENTQRIVFRLMLWTSLHATVFTGTGIASAVLFIVQSDSFLWVGILSVSQQFFSISFLASQISFFVSVVCKLILW